MAELRGKRAIMAHMGLGWETILYMHKNQGFPMFQIKRLWFADTVAIKRWKWRKMSRRNA